MKLKNIPLTEIIIALAIIRVLVVPNVFGLDNYPNMTLRSTLSTSQVSADKRTASSIGRAVRLWVDYEKGELPAGPVKYSELEGLTPYYITGGYSPRSYDENKKAYYVCAVGKDDDKKIIVGIGNESTCDLPLPKYPINIKYSGEGVGWVYSEGVEGIDWYNIK